jgi:hypothetical protein
LRPDPEGLFEGIMAFLEEVQVSELKLVFHTGWNRFGGPWITMGTTTTSKYFDRKDTFQLFSDGPIATIY